VSAGPATPPLSRLLLHVCCGPCASGAFPFWLGKTDRVTAFFFNPNIHPFLEYRRRLSGARDVADYADIDLVVDDSYDPEEWFASVSKGPGSRCERCISLRLDRAAQEAAALGCEAFSTTLSISPWQDHESIRAEGEKAARQHGPRFLYEDLRPLYGDSRRLSLERGIYRQKYCGCLVSECERYRDLR
jgi:predicted adenine nucleotide alpha hydrolase (AANH) superfamily ATPase